MRLAPGAAAALAAGCICTEMGVNFYGRGSAPTWARPRQFLIEAECPLHGWRTWPRVGAQERPRPPPEALRWEGDAFHALSDAQRAEAPAGRLTVARHRRPPDPAKPFEGRFCGTLVGYWPSMAAGRDGMAAWYAQHHG